MMAEERTFKIRVTYGKTGRLAMLSHLEVTHALERMVRRAGLPFATSNGFSPHMKIAFGSALPVGTGGAAEIFDVQLSSYVAPAKVLAALQASAPADMMPQECKYIEKGAKAASVAFPYSLYEVSLLKAPSAIEVPSEVTVVRKGKEKTLKVADYLVGEPVLEGSTLRFQTRSGEGGTLRADVLAKAVVGEEAIGSISRIAQSDAPI